MLRVEIVRRFLMVSSRPVEIQNGMVAILLGLMLISPAPVFQTASGGRIFLESGIPEAMWGMIFLMLGVFQTLSAVLDNVVSRRLSAAMLGVFYAFYLAGIMLSNPFSPAQAFLLPAVCSQVWAFFQARRVF